MSVAEKVVCVTGASGYIASWLVKLLLQRGYTVNASIRDPAPNQSGLSDENMEKWIEQLNDGMAGGRSVITGIPLSSIQVALFLRAYLGSA